MNRRDMVLAILAAANGQSFTPVQIQKAAFLINTNLPQIIDGAGFSFAPYDYGPFDRAVYSEVENLKMVGQATVEQTSNRWRTYAATPAGIAEGKRLLRELPSSQSSYIQRVAEWVRSMDFATLVKSIYEAYPEMRANSIFQG